MTVKELIQILEKHKPNSEIRVASDEEWNTIFGKVRVTFDEETKTYIIYGLSGSELEE